MDEQTLLRIGRLREHNDSLTSLRETSNDSSNKQYMTDSQISVINFDLLKEQRFHPLNLEYSPASADALYVSESSLYLIEFKNGRVDEKEILKKIYDSIILLFDREVVTNLSDCVERLSFILVYNDSKLKKGQDNSPSRKQVHDHIAQLGNSPTIFSFLTRFKKYFFKNIHAWSKEEFHCNFVKKYDGK